MLGQLVSAKARLRGTSVRIFYDDCWIHRYDDGVVGDWAPNTLRRLVPGYIEITIMPEGVDQIVARIRIQTQAVNVYGIPNAIIRAGALWGMVGFVGLPGVETKYLTIGKI